MTHRVSPIDDHRRIVPGRAGGSSPAGDCASVPLPSRRAAAHPPARTAPATGRPAPGGARAVTGRVAAPGRALAAYR
ncbi:hypothetical protein ACFHW0_09115 [Micromonospora sp. LOL_025]|uniref:hypothetical protein n=1 Tax=Micromonospora sp. LOL_025 TaxID=3345413 RepID=UPI003A8A688B